MKNQAATPAPDGSPYIPTAQDFPPGYWKEHGLDKIDWARAAEMGVRVLNPDEARAAMEAGLADMLAFAEEHAHDPD